ncbi:MAG: hypothetical protein ACYDBQ_00785 [Thermoplasmatota archaeon]
MPCPRFSKCCTSSLANGFKPDSAGRTWFSTCSAVARNRRPRVLTLTQPSPSRKYCSVAVGVWMRIT